MSKIKKSSLVTRQDQCTFECPDGGCCPEGSNCMPPNKCDILCFIYDISCGTFDDRDLFIFIYVEKEVPYPKTGPYWKNDKDDTNTKD
ncbi:hypothetical protein GLOIN_2v1844090 [Rhizophagus clarus]|uniref:Uncharacterized protein n=1 Tax=Rhizophagus clarus TaxID=94130 RepID=A0A8H3LE43_9GLOM|nr:hypothetical protein GLOIN_2v1844090 [Rhizophagus clarus]